MADPLTRQQRRKLEREHVKSGLGFIAKGLTAQPRREQIRDVAAALKAKLSERANVRRASEAAAMAQSLNEASISRSTANPKIACKKGCFYCCAGFVGVTPPEVFRLANAIRSGGAPTVSREVVSATAVQTQALDPQSRVGAKIVCPVLVDGHCGAYADRPLVCRQATSLSLPGCLEEYEGRGSLTDRIEVSSIHLTHASSAHVALLGALVASNLPATAYELASALDIALASADSETRWLAGDDIFAGLPQQVKRPADVELVTRRIAEDLGS